MALLRAVGASSRQVLSAQLLEAVIVGLVASVVGLGAGVFVAGALKAMMAGFGIDIPAGGTVFKSRTAVVALVVGTSRRWPPCGTWSSSSPDARRGAPSTGRSSPPVACSR
jgi:ABC-type antimicrobial peptide transport system permease subunit